MKFEFKAWIEKNLYQMVPDYLNILKIVYDKKEQKELHEMKFSGNKQYKITIEEIIE